MKISAIKKELDERGVSYRGLFEKYEFVELLVDARVRAITAPPAGVSNGDSYRSSGGGGDDGNSGTDSSSSDTDVDPSYKDVEVSERGKRGVQKYLYLKNEHALLVVRGRAHIAGL